MEIYIQLWDPSTGNYAYCLQYTKDMGKYGTPYFEDLDKDGAPDMLLFNPVTQNFKILFNWIPVQPVSYSGSLCWDETVPSTIIEDTGSLMFANIIDSVNDPAFPDISVVPSYPAPFASLTAFDLDMYGWLRVADWD